MSKNPLPPPTKNLRKRKDEHKKYTQKSHHSALTSCVSVPSFLLTPSPRKEKAGEAKKQRKGRIMISYFIPTHNFKCDSCSATLISSSIKPISEYAPSLRVLSISESKLNHLNSSKIAFGCYFTKQSIDCSASHSTVCKQAPQVGPPPSDTTPHLQIPNNVMDPMLFMTSSSLIEVKL